MSEERVVGFGISGFGTAGVHLSGNFIRLSTASFNAVSGTRRYVSQLESWPRRIRTEVEPLDGLTTQGTISFLLTDLDRPTRDNFPRNYGKLALEFFWGTRSQAIATLSVDVNASTTTFNVESLAGAAPAGAGDILFIGREVFYVEAVGGAAPNLVLVVTRGVLESVADVHDSRDPLVYRANQLNIDREVVVYDYDHATDTETARFRGVVENFELASDLKSINVSCRDVLGRIADRTLGVNRWVDKVEVKGYPNEIVDRRSYWILTNKTPVPYRPLYAEDDGTVGTFGVGKVIVAEIDGHAVVISASNDTGPLDESWKFTHEPRGFNSGAALDGRMIDADNRGKTYTIREILISDKNSPFSLYKDGDEVPTDHPANLIRNILMSTGSATWPAGGAHTVGINGDYDWLPAPWGLSIDSDLIDQDSFDFHVERFPTRDLRYRNFWLGAGDELPKATETLFDLAQACSSYLFVDAFGRIGIRHLRDPGPKGVDVTIGADDILWVRGAANEAESAPLTVESVYAIRMELAAQGPGGKPAQVLLASNLEEMPLSRLKYLAKEDKIESTVVYGDPETHTVSDNTIIRIGAAFRSRFAYTQNRLPVYDLETSLAAGAPFITAGMWASVSHPAFIDLDYTRGIVNHRCLVLSADWDPEKLTQKIRIVDWSPASTFTTIIASSWQIGSVSSDTVFNLETDIFTDSQDTTFWKNAADGDYRLALWSADGLLRSDNGPEGTLAGITVTLAGAFTLSAAPVTPLIGDVVRIFTYEAASDWVVEEVYSYLGDGAGKVDSGTVAAGEWAI